MPEEIRARRAALLAFLRERRVDVLDCTPTQLRLLLEAGLAGPGGPRLVLVGGEAVDAGLWATLAADPDRRFVDVYGPTECTVDATACPITPGRPTIGRPLANVRTYVLDARLRPVPAGAPGELCIGGAGVARGYARRPDADRRALPPRSLLGGPGARLYRTGDRVRQLPDGALEFLGRARPPGQAARLPHRAGRDRGGAARASGGRRRGGRRARGPAGERRLVAYVVPKRRAGRAGDRRRRRLPNGMAVAEQNRNETEYLFREIFENRCYVSHGIRLPEAPVVDVGANIGMFSLFVARHRPAARIYAFEPLAPLFETLQVNAGFYAPGARLFPFGLAERERREEFTFYPRYTMMSGRSASADAAGEVEVIKRFLTNARDSRSAEDAAALLEHADELLAGRFEGELHEVRLRRLSECCASRGSSGSTCSRWTCSGRRWTSSPVSTRRTGRGYGKSPWRSTTRRGGRARGGWRRSRPCSKRTASPSRPSRTLSSPAPTGTTSTRCGRGSRGARSAPPKRSRRSPRRRASWRRPSCASSRGGTCPR